jgi:hypothetical protein
VIPSAGASSEGSVASRPHRPRRERTGTRPRVARERHPAVATSPKAVACSRDRGCNDHRILRRVSCRRKASWVITRCFGHAKHPRVISAHQHHLRPAHQGQKPRTRRSCSPGEGRGGVRRGWGATGVSEARSHQRRGKKTPTLMTKAVRQKSWGTCCIAIRRSGPNVVKRSVPRSCRTEPKTPWGVPAAKVASANREHTRCRVHAVRLGGRNRLDASRVFHAGRPQGLLVRKGASLEEVRSTA